MSETNGHAPATAQELRERSRKTVTVNGASFVIRALGVDQLMARGVIPQAIVLDQGGDGQSIISRFMTDEGGLEKRIDAALQAALVLPVVWWGPEAECPPDQVPSSDLGAFRLGLFNAIIGQSGLTAEVAEAARFRDEPGDGGSGVPAGEEVGANAPGGSDT